ncbi:WxL domain-containing protein [Lentzea sp. NPDC005914]|uniref:WxL domain-containing protein n=1 Tax=Lentzea sp. NPDC005914 TaxID=3154572 RepID=UPI0033D16AB9
MFSRRIGARVAGVAAAIAICTAVPASAVDSTVSFATTGGTLSVAVPASATLTGGSTVPGGTVSGALGTVTVTDARGNAAGWTASVYSTTGFTASGSTAITNSSVTYTPGATTSTTTPGSPTITAGTAGSPGANAGAALTAYTYANATAGGNTVSWNPTIAVVIPLTAIGGATYSGTVSHQVA